MNLDRLNPPNLWMTHFRVIKGLNVSNIIAMEKTATIIRTVRYQSGITTFVQLTK